MATTADIPDILRAAGCAVEVEDTWDLEPLGPFPTANPKLMWHHDASGVGPSPGALGWITSSYRSGVPSAQLWVDTEGVWHCIGKGKASHAGPTDGSATNSDSVGVETDHTTGEAWHPKLLASLRQGSAALLRAFGRTPDNGLFFHKTSAVPYGRKQDPDGLELAEERRLLGALMAGTTPSTPTPSVPTPTPTEEDEMAALATLLEAQLAEQKATNALLREQLAQTKTGVARLGDCRTFLEQIRDSFVRWTAGRDVPKVNDIGGS